MSRACPSVACLMVTRGRVDEAIAAIGFYAAQDHPARSLVVVADGESHGSALERYIRDHDVAGARVVAVPEGSRSLGALRNLSVALAQSDYVCQWDDDDVYHPRRLSVQLDGLLRTPGAAACFMADQLHFFVAAGSVYWCDWSQPRTVKRWPRVIPNTLLCARAKMPKYPEEGPMSSRSEDLHVMNELIARGGVVQLIGRGPMYVYVSHGANTCDAEHHRRIPRLTGLGKADLLRRRSALAATLPFLLPGGTIVRTFDDEAVFRLQDDGDLVEAAGDSVDRSQRRVGEAVGDGPLEARAPDASRDIGGRQRPS
jgi:glycosyltransferase involved in cell wall biosynthesis